jgi:hypothetical protein
VIIAGCFGVIIAAAYEAFATVPYVVTATLFGCSTGVLFMGLAAIIENTENTAHCLQALCQHHNIEIKIDTIINQGEQKAQ